MADLEKTVKILFSGVDNLSTPLKSMSSKVDTFGNNISKIGAPLHNVTKGVLALDAAIAALVVGGLAYSINQFATFEDRMLKVKGVLGASKIEYEQLTDLTKELGATTRFTAEEAASGLEFLALAGMSATESMEALPRVLELAQASGLALKDTADIVTNIMAGYGIETDKLAATNDVLTATFTNSNTSLQQLGQAFMFVGPVAKSLGFTIEETSAVLGILGNAGYQAEKGGTALRNIMLALVAPAGNMGKLMKELGVNTSELGVDFASSRNALDSLGVSIKDSSGNILPFSDILGQVKTGLEKIPDAADRTATLIEIFGKRGGPQMAALLSQGTDALDGMKEKINSLGGITGDIAAEMESGVGGIKRALVSAFDAVTIEIGDKAADAIENGAKSMVDLLRVIASEVDADTFKPLFDLLADFSNKLGENLRDIAVNLPDALDGVDFGGLAKSLKELGDIFGGLFDSVDLTTAEGLEEGIQNIVDGLSKLTATTTGIAEILVKVGGVIIEVVASLKSLDDEQWETVGNIAAIGTALTGLATVVAVGGALLTGINAFSNLFKAGSLLTTGVSGVIALLTGPLGLAVAVGTLGTVVAKFTLKSINDENEAAMKIIKAHGKEIDNLIDSMNGVPAEKSSEIFILLENDDLEGAKLLIDELTAEEHLIKVAAEIENEELNKFFEAWDGVDDEKELQITAAINAGDFELVESLIADETKDVVVDVKNIEEVKKEVEEVTNPKILEIELKGDFDLKLAQIKASAETAQTAFEWTAKLDIADIEAAAKVASSAFDSIGDSVTATAGATASMFGDLITNMNDLQTLDKWKMTDLVEEEQEAQNKLIDSQIKLNDAQAKYMEARADAMENGDGEIKISSDGLEPSLEMIMWQIIEKVQIRASESQSEFLLGV